MAIRDAKEREAAGMEKFRVLSPIEMPGKMFVPAPGEGLSQSAVQMDAGRLKVISGSHGRLIDIDDSGFIRLSPKDAKAMLRSGAIAPLDAPPVPPASKEEPPSRGLVMSRRPMAQAARTYQW